MKTSSYIAAAIITLSVLCATAVLAFSTGKSLPQPVTQATAPAIEINWGEGVDVRGVSDNRETRESTRIAQK